MKSTSHWFEVDKEGLAKLREDTPKSALIMELVQNAWDTNADECSILLRREAAHSKFFELIVEDNDPDGFADLTHAYTLFAESGKKGNAEKRGRFNFGEKLVLAMCKMACIESKTGTVVFHENGSRTENTKNARLVGSRFTGILKMTQEEYDQARADIFTLLPPLDCHTTFNGVGIPRLTPIKTVEAVLPTVIVDVTGNLRPTRRKCVIEIFEPQYSAGQTCERPMIYEMGIPVVETEDRYHYNVLQKVPLNLDRSNVPPAFLRAVREAVAEAVVDLLTPEDANSTWVREAASSGDASKELVTKVFESRFGRGAVIYDPSDPEANQRALADGRTVVKGGHMSKAEWTNVKDHGIALPAGKIFTDHKVVTSPDGKPWTPAAKMTPGMEKVKEFSRWLSKEANSRDIQVDFVVEPTLRVSACYGSGILRFNIGKLGYEAFETGLTLRLLRLVIHELSHERAENHLTDLFHEECTRIGARAVEMALSFPSRFEELGMKPLAVA